MNKMTQVLSILMKINIQVKVLTEKKRVSCEEFCNKNEKKIYKSQVLFIIRQWNLVCAFENVIWKNYLLNFLQNKKTLWVMWDRRPGDICLKFFANKKKSISIQRSRYYKLIQNDVRLKLNTNLATEFHSKGFFMDFSIFLKTSGRLKYLIFASQGKQSNKILFTHINWLLS